MTETDVQNYEAELQKMFGNQHQSPQKGNINPRMTYIQPFEQNPDDRDSYMYQSPFRSSDPTVIDRKRIIGFEKTGQLLRKMKRELSTKNFDMQSQQSRRTNKKISTQHSIDPRNRSRLNWNENQNDEMTQAIMDDYEKQIITLKAELDDTTQEKRKIKQTLQNERKFFMAQMYSKEMIIQENDCQIQKLREEIEKHVSLEFQLQQKIRLLQLKNSQYKYELQGLLKEQDKIDKIDEENQDFFMNDQAEGQNQSKKRKSDILFASLSDNFGRSNFFDQQQDKLETIKQSHQREIQKYQKQINHIREFYEIKLRALRISLSPQLPQKNRASISILDEYVCRDSLSCHSQVPHNLRSILRQHMNFDKSGRKVDDNQSFATVKYFKYPQNTKKVINNFDYGEDLFIREPEHHERQEVSKIEFTKQEKKESKIKQLLKKLTPSNQFLKGFGIGSLIIGIGTTLALPNLTKK